MRSLPRVALLSLGFVLLAAAADAPAPAPGTASATAPTASAAKGAAVVSGEVIDSACYIRTGAKGESHRECAQRCGDVGIPLALLEDGTGQVIWLASVNDMETPNAMLRPHAGRKVRVTGRWAERGGAKLLLVEKVEAARR